MFQKNVSNPQPLPLLLEKVSQYTPNLYCNTPPVCIAVLLVPLRSEEREILSVLLPSYASHLYCNTPPICIAIRLPFVSQCFWENLGGCGHQDVPHNLPGKLTKKGELKRPQKNRCEFCARQSQSQSQFIENKRMFLGSWAFWASGAFSAREQIRHFQAKSGTFKQNQALSGKIRLSGMFRGMIFPALP